ncbi:hypothetical protein [Secundilactobacillus kimchicus]|nr:hypothetical protein [Secundilactobacillus kimchicus]MBT9673012.1 hypothetical protein [Secundilactobacillus kimchicus]
MSDSTNSDFDSLYSQFIDGFIQQPYADQQAVLKALSDLSEARKNR